MLVYFALGDAKVWHWGSKPMPIPNANGFASQWNVGLNSNCMLTARFGSLAPTLRCVMSEIEVNL